MLGPSENSEYISPSFDACRISSKSSNICTVLNKNCDRRRRYISWYFLARAKNELPNFSQKTTSMEYYRELSQSKSLSKARLNSHPFISSHQKTGIPSPTAAYSLSAPFTSVSVPHSSGKDAIRPISLDGACCGMCCRLGDTRFWESELNWYMLYLYRRWGDTQLWPVSALEWFIGLCPVSYSFGSVMSVVWCGAQP